MVQAPIMAVYDCFMFNNELDLLELRLSVLDGVVDRFILVEAGQTHAGLAKPLHFQENADRFARWRGRVQHVVPPRLPPGIDAWDNAATQRNAIAPGLPEVMDNGLLIVSDIDEIPRRESIGEVLAEPSIRTAGFRIRFSISVSTICKSRAGTWFMSGVSRHGGEIHRKLGPQGPRDARVTLQ
jgi:hypothetical protein